MIVAKVFLLIACFDLCLAKTDLYLTGLAPTESNGELHVYDFVYRCMRQYSENLFRALHHDFSTLDQIDQECILYTEFQECLAPKSGDTYVAMFIAGLGEEMKFCQCFDELNDFLNMPGVNEASAANIVCPMYEVQADCLQTYFYRNPFVKDVLAELDVKLDSDYCDIPPTLSTDGWVTPGTASTPQPEPMTDGLTTDPGTWPATMPATMHATVTSPEEGPGSVRGHCSETPHPHSRECAHWLHGNYHTINPGWKPCPGITSGGYSRPCGYWWAKCSKVVKNKPCCISAHCYGVRGA